MSSALFQRMHLHDFLKSRFRLMLDSIDALKVEEILSLPQEKYIGALIEKFSPTVPILFEENITSEATNVKVDVSYQRDRDFRNRTGPNLVDGIAVDFIVPWNGDPDIFHTVPSSIIMTEVGPEIAGRTLIFQYSFSELDGELAKRKFEEHLSYVRQMLKNCQIDVNHWSTTLRDQLLGKLLQRREKLLKNREEITKLGYPLRSREPEMATYAVPEIKRKILPELSMLSAKPAQALDPVLDEENFVFILDVVKRMAIVMEQNRAAFSEATEETIRSHFLVQLNGHYENFATGETFNAAGKTDILIRYKGKNIFVAECKFWKGAKSLVEALDQLLSYATWRDGKAALFLFNRGTKLTTVLDSIPNAVQGYSRYFSEFNKSGETEFRFKLKHPDDDGRYIDVSILVFEVPGNE